MIQMQSIDWFSFTGLLIVELAPVRTSPQSKEETSSPMGNDPHHGAIIMFGDTIIYDAQKQITLNLKQ